MRIPIQPLGTGLTFWIRVNLDRANGAEMEKSGFAPIVPPMAEPDDFRKITYTPWTSAQREGLFFPAFSLDSQKDFSSSEKASHCELRLGRKKQTKNQPHIFKVGNKRFNLVGKRGRQHGNSFGCLEMFTISEIVGGSKVE